MNISLARRVVAEFFGTAFLVAAVVGSGIMADHLSNGNVGLALLENTIATGAALVALIVTFGPISGAHLNPVITVMDAFEGGLPWIETPLYVLGQVLGGIGGAVAAHLMFGLSPVSLSTRVRSGPSQVFSEFIATFGLVCVVWGSSRLKPTAVPFAVGAYITAAYWFTASTSFANPAVTIARCLSNTFAGIRPGDVPWFIIAQFAGGFGATLLFRWLAPNLRTRASELLVAHDGPREN
jgi:glycerol uptake facilitator-like aquaporin